MKIEHKTIDEKQGVIRITTTDERWYSLPNTKGDPKFVPSSSWISSFYPKGTAFYKWLAEHGWDEAEAIKISAGTRGSKIHTAVEALVQGVEIKHDTKIKNVETGELEELQANEYKALIDFKEWWDELVDPKVLASEETIYNEEHGYAGTVDLVIEVGEKGKREIWLIDLKTGLSVYPNYIIQLSSYLHGTYLNPKLKDLRADKMFILQVGYTRNKNKQFKLTEYEDQFELFLAAKQIWEYEVANKDPKELELPLSVKI